ncbi:unnamed protein product, partial [Tetraodon nigroviridis]
MATDAQLLGVLEDYNRRLADGCQFGGESEPPRKGTRGSSFCRGWRSISTNLYSFSAEDDGPRDGPLHLFLFKGATDDILPKMASTLLNLRLCEADSGKLSSLLELPGSLLIVPQATLGGEAKGRAVQYHTDISKEDGL